MSERTKAVTAKEVIQILVATLNRGGEDSNLLWDVISALRGPDNADDRVKKVSTMRVRRIIGLSDDYNSGFRRAMVDRTGVKPMHFGLLHTVGDTHAHFVNHYQYAVEALVALGYDMGTPEPGTPE